MLINAEPVLSAIDGYRLVWIAGRVGGHKTSLAYMIAKRYLERGYRLITNTKCVWSDNIENLTLDENGQLKAVVVFDEGGLYFSSPAQVKTIAAYLAKMDIVVIMPSFWAPSTAAQVITIQPLWNLKATGLPFVLYRWQVKIQSFKDKGYFGWVYPNEIYGLYSRQDPGDDPAALVKFLTKQTTEYRKFHGYSKNNIPVMEETESDLLLEVAAQFQEAAGSIEAVSKRKSRRR